MAENSKIEWTDHTFNPWIGCTKVSPGCAHCYADAQDQFRKWTPEGWGKDKPRKRTSIANWRQPLKWNEEAAKALGEYEAHSALHGGHPHYSQPRRPRVFCASLADWLDDEVPIEWLADLLALIFATPNLDWLLLTKRPENFRKRVASAAIACVSPVEQWLIDWLFPVQGEGAPDNVWIGTTVEDQTRADERIPALLAIPALIRFLSCEPLLSALDLTRWFYLQTIHRQDYLPDRSVGPWYFAGYQKPEPSFYDPPVLIHWVIAGGESGGKARPMHTDWARSLRDQCTAAAVPFLFKQWGEWQPTENNFAYRAARQFLELNGRDSTGWDTSRHSASTANMQRVGKAAAGRTLDGREWNEFPNPQSAIRDPQ